MDRSAYRKTAAGGWTRPRVLLVAIVVIVVAVVAAVAIFGDDPEPVAEGRESDACTGRGPGALVGLDLRTGKVRWTNVVGRDLLSIEPHGTGKVLVRQEDRRRDRVVSMATGAVERCLPGGTDPNIEAAPDAVVPPASATDGPGRFIIGAFREGVAVTVDRPRSAGPGVALKQLEVIDPSNGSVLWSRALDNAHPVVTAHRLVTLDPPPSPLAGAPQKTAVRAYRLGDGTPVWTTTVPDAYRLFGSEQLIFAVRYPRNRLSAVDAETGAIRWSVELANPGRGGRWSDPNGTVQGVVVDEDADIVVVAIRAEEPYRD